MINIIDKKLCCGCEACVQACPRSCISFHEDKEGFRYPKVELEKCIDCGLCEKVCPLINVKEKRTPIKCYAAKNLNEEERLKSSSGGIFILLAKKIINQGGVVFGARFDKDWSVVHSYTDTIEGLEPFMGSKYVQSRIGDSYIRAKDFLSKGRSVLFVGTPCQIAGLRGYLRKEYDNLLTVDLICHGVPSPAVWKQYLEEIKINARKGKNTVSRHPNSYVTERDALGNGGEVEIKSISFRNKSLGWQKYSFALTLAEAAADGKKNTVSLSRIHKEDPYFLGFNNHSFYLRPSCYACGVKELRSGSDLTLADFWGIDTLLPEMDDDIGVSALIVNTQKGAIEICGLSLVLSPVEYEDIVVRNKAIIYSFPEPKNSLEDKVRLRSLMDSKRDYFFSKSNRSVSERVSLLSKPGYLYRLKIFVSRICRLVLK